MGTASEGTNGSAMVLMARVAQALGSGLTMWGILLHLGRFPHISLFLLGFPAAALVVAFKKTDNLRVRAFYCFTSAGLANSVVFGHFGLALILMILHGGRPGGFGLPIEEQLLLAAAALYTFAGAFFWVVSKAVTPDISPDEA